MTVAEYIAGRFKKAGIRFIFGLPGGPSIPYMEAFRKAGIEFILTSNERSAATMACVSYRITGVPGLCHATFGPGATNISTGIGEALLDRSAVIVLTSEVPDAMLNRTTQMHIDHQCLFEPITKKTYRLTPGNAVRVIEESLAICQDEYPGPIHIGLPSDIAEVEIHEPGNDIVSPERKVYENNLSDVISLLENKRHPLLAVGLTAFRLGIGKMLSDFLDEYRIPVVLTPMAKGIISEDHPCYAGVLFHALGDYLENVWENADLVIGLGYDQVEYNYESWMPDVPLLHLNTVKTDLPSRENIVSFFGYPDDWFRLLRNLSPGTLIQEKSAGSVRNEIQSVLNGFIGHFGPVTALKVLGEELPADTILTADVGSHLHLVGQYWKVKAPGRLLITNGWSSMGFGIPAALAAQIERPGFLMMAGEVVTALRYKLPIIIVVFSDGELNLIRLKQSWKEIPPYGTSLYSGDLFTASHFLGVKVITTDSKDSLRKAVNLALSLDEPVIINAVIDPDDYKWLIVKPG